MESPKAADRARDSFNANHDSWRRRPEGTEHSSRARDIARTHVGGTLGAATASLAYRRYAAASLGDRGDASPDGRARSPTRGEQPELLASSASGVVGMTTTTTAGPTTAPPAPSPSKPPRAVASSSDRRDADDDDADLGRVFVAVRLRPTDGPEHASFLARDGVRVAESRPSWLPRGTPSPAWEADAVFAPEDGNAAVYARAARPVVRAVLRGVNGTVMAYGQTSSGKTHTMSGVPSDPGVMQRAVEDIFERVERDRDVRRYDVRCSYMEIYNEDVRDLLRDNNNGGAVAAANAPNNAMRDGGGGVKLVVGSSGLTRVRGLEERVVTRASEVIDIVEQGAARRATNKTSLNASSSRSHAVLRIVVASGAFLSTLRFHPSIGFNV